MMMVPHHVAQQMMLAQQGGGRGAGKGKSKKWTREGAEENVVGDEMDTSKIPCIFLASISINPIFFTRSFWSTTT